MNETHGERSWIAGAVLAARAGDRDAFARLVETHARVVSAIVFGITRDLACVDDVSQEIFVAAWRSLATLDAPERFSGWLRQIARYQATDSLRRRMRAGSRLADFAETSYLADPAGDAHTELVRSAEAREVSESLARLAPLDREVLILYYQEGESLAQVARSLELREPAVRKRLSRARGRLRAEIGARLAAVGVGPGFVADVLRQLPAGAPPVGIPAPFSSLGISSVSKMVAGVGVTMIAATLVLVAGARFGMFGGAGAKSDRSAGALAAQQDQSAAASGKEGRVVPQNRHGASAVSHSAASAQEGPRRSWTELYVAGSTLTSEEADALEAAAAKTSDSFEHRATLIGYYAVPRIKAALTRDTTLADRWAAHVLWIIEHFPSEPDGGMCMTVLAEPIDSKASHEAIRDAWTRQIAEHPGDAVLLDEAAKSISQTDRGLSQAWLAIAVQLSPSDLDLRQSLAQQQSFAGYDASEEEKTEATNQALATLEEALSSAAPEERVDLLYAGAPLAFKAGEFEKARRYATELLERANEMPKAWDELHKGNIVLGRLALKAGDVKTAAKHLVAAGKVSSTPVLSSFGPDFTLARDLLAAGEKQAVITYLDSCARFWEGKGENLSRWKAEIQAGKTPKFKRRYVDD